MPGGLDRRSAPRVALVHFGLGVPEGYGGTKRDPDRLGPGLTPSEPPGSYGHPLRREGTMHLAGLCVDIALDEGPPPLECLDALDDKPGKLGRSRRARFGKLGEPVRRSDGRYSVELTGNRGSEPLGRGIRLSPIRPDVPVNATRERGVRPAIVGEVKHLGEHVPRHGGKHVMGLENVERQVNALFPPVVPNPSQDPRKRCAIGCRVFGELKSAPSGSEGLAIEPKLGQHRGQSVGGEIGLGMVLADLTGHQLSRDRVSGEKVRDRDLAPGLDGPLAAVLLLGLAQDLSSTGMGFDVANELSGLLAVKVPEPTKRALRVALEPALLREAHRPMIASCLLALVPRGPAHRIIKCCAGLVVVAERLVLIGPVEVRRGDRERVDLASEEDRSQPAKEPSSLDGCRATSTLMNLPPHAMSLTWERTIAPLDLHVPDDGDRRHGAGDFGGHIHLRSSAPEPLDFVQEFGQRVGAASKALADRICGETVRRPPDGKERCGGRYVLKASRPDGSGDVSESMGGWTDPGLERAFLAEQEPVVRQAMEEGENLSCNRKRDGARRTRVRWRFVEHREEARRSLETNFIASNVGDLNDSVSTWTKEGFVPNDPIERRFQGLEHEAG